MSGTQMSKQDFVKLYRPLALEGKSCAAIAQFMGKSEAYVATTASNLRKVLGENLVPKLKRAKRTEAVDTVRSELEAFFADLDGPSKETNEETSEEVGEEVGETVEEVSDDELV